MDRAQQVFDRLQELGKISEDADCLTRQYGTEAMRHANELVGSWMKQAGMEVRIDAIGNLIGTSKRGSSGKTLLLGSHLEELKDKNLPFDITVLGFADEEGVRFQSTYLGSRAIAGSFDDKDLKRADANGVTLGDAIKNFGGDPAKLSTCRFDPKNLVGYIEVHIEQGPVLEQKNLGVGVVTAIAGQTRCKIRFEGKAGHAGTTPMNMRQDALCAAAEFVLAVEQTGRRTNGLVATVGQIANEPNVSNVIPAVATVSLDVRHQKDTVRNAIIAALENEAISICESRELDCRWQVVQETKSVPCDARISELLRKAAGKHQAEVIDLPSGAGHDAAVVGKICPMGMLFVRCKGGLSHHPDESMTADDARVALATLVDFVRSL
jgi:allantoate deiminase